MKKLLIFPLLLLSVLLIQSCRKEIKICTAKVSEVKDSTEMLTQIGDYEIKFDIKDARFTHGAVMQGDSVRINYIGELSKREAKALVVYILPKPGNVVDAVYNPDTELKTREMSEEKRERFKEFVRITKQRGNEGQ